MKSWTMPVLLIICIFTLTGCTFLSGTPLQGFGDSVSAFVSSPKDYIAKDSPEKEVKLYIDALRDKDYNRALTYLSAESSKYYAEEPLKLADVKVGKGFKFIRNIRSTDDWKDMLFAYDGNDKQEAIVVRENGKWKIKSVQPFADDI